MSKISIEAHDTVTSTMDIARELARQGREEGTVVVAGTQTQGRGRSSSEWFSPRGGVWLSVLLIPPTEAERSHRAVFLSGLCACTVLRELCDLDTVIRWPNDILFGGRKLAGVLGEGIQADDTFYSIVGVGVNTNFSISALPEELRNETTTTLDILGREVDNESIVVAMAELLVERSVELSGGYGRILDEWLESSDTVGQIVDVDGSPAGRAVRLDDEGFLMVEDESGEEKRVVSGNLRYAGDRALRKG
ncbi:MAG: biotin--[acetyl-CoA-carboxylase] ligase [Thermoplasmata archaeon]|nr:biotin--[acetyl-CoA-carboxylase] ligase [Candidatus Thermoplasmatota archaeon]MCK4949609.1 biotin--[acetyl-CoA-carboxylase] ligase [Thermoplasmata archaeon]